MYKIVRFVLIMTVTVLILYPLLRHVERKSPLHLVIKPEAEARVRHSPEAKQLIGDSMTFGSESFFSYSVQGQTGTGDFTMPVKGNVGSGDVEVTAVKADGMWRVDQIILVAGGKRLPVVDMR